MHALIIYTTFEVSSSIVNNVAKIIASNGETGDKFEIKQLKESDIRQLLVSNNQPGAVILEKRPAFPTVEEVDAAILFVTEHFGDPRDSESAVRARMNGKWYRQPKNTPEFNARLRNCVQIFAHCYNAEKASYVTLKQLENIRFAWAPEYCAALLRFENME